MRDEARIYLGIVRDATAQNIMIPIPLHPIIKKHLGITDQETMEIGELLKADAREEYMNSPQFSEINAILESFPKLT